MPGDGFSLSVEVSGEPDFIGGFCEFLQVGNDFLAAWRNDVGRGKIIVQINARNRLTLGTLGEISHMTYGGLDHVIGTKVPVDGFGLRRGFHNDKLLTHEVNSVSCLQREVLILLGGLPLGLIEMMNLIYGWRVVSAVQRLSRKNDAQYWCEGSI